MQLEFSQIWAIIAYETNIYEHAFHLALSNGYRNYPAFFPANIPSRRSSSLSMSSPTFLSIILA